MTELKLFYLVAGFLLLTNIGTIVAVLKDKAKENYNKGYQDGKLEKNLERIENKADLAHNRIDKLKKTIKGDEI